MQTWKMKKNIDQENLLGIIKESPDQLLVGIKLAQNVTFRKRFNGFFYCSNLRDLGIDPNNFTNLRSF